MINPETPTQSRQVGEQVPLPGEFQLAPGDPFLSEPVNEPFANYIEAPAARTAETIEGHNLGELAEFRKTLNPVHEEADKAEAAAVDPGFPSRPEGVQALVETVVDEGRFALEEAGIPSPQKHIRPRWTGMTEGRKGTWGDVENNPREENRASKESAALLDKQLSGVVSIIDAIHSREKISLKKSDSFSWEKTDEPSATYATTNLGLSSPAEKVKGARFGTKTYHQIKDLKEISRGLGGDSAVATGEKVERAVAGVNRITATAEDRGLVVPFLKQVKKAEYEAIMAAIDTASSIVDKRLIAGEPLEKVAIADEKKVIGLARRLHKDGRLNLRKMGPLRECFRDQIVVGPATVAQSLARNICIVKTYRKRGSEDSISVMTEQLNQLGSDFEHEAVVSGEAKKAPDIEYARTILHEQGIDTVPFNEELAKSMSRDIGDFTVIADSLLGAAPTEEQRRTILYNLSNAYLKNGHDERASAFSEKNGLSGPHFVSGSFSPPNYDYIAYTPYGMGRTLEIAHYLSEQLDVSAAHDESGHAQDLKELITIDAFENLELCCARNPEGLPNVDQIDQLVSAAAASLGESKYIRALSIANKAYSMHAADKQDLGGLRAVSAFQEDFVTYLDDAGNLANDSLLQFNELDSELGTMDNSSQRAVAELVLADTVVAAVEKVTGNTEQAGSSSDKVEHILQAVPNAREAVGKMLAFRQEVLTAQEVYMGVIKKKAYQNTTAFQLWATGHYKDDFGSRNGRDDIEDEARRIEPTLGVSVNLSPEALKAIMLSPPYRFKSIYEVSARTAMYDIDRDREEVGMGIRTPSRLLCEPQPIYGAVMSANGRDEYLGGAPGGYGALFVELNTNNIKDRTVVIPRDSFFGPTQGFPVDFEHASEVVAVNNITNAKYAEAQILGGVTASDIKTICIDKKMMPYVGDMIQGIRQAYPDLEIREVDSSVAARSKQSVRSLRVSSTALQ